MYFSVDSITGSCVQWEGTNDVKGTAKARRLQTTTLSWVSFHRQFLAAQNLPGHPASSSREPNSLQPLLRSRSQSTLQAHPCTFEVLAQAPCQNQSTKCHTGLEQQVWAEPHKLLALANAGPTCRVPCCAHAVCLPLFHTCLGCSTPKAQGETHGGKQSLRTLALRPEAMAITHTGSASCCRTTHTPT